MIQIKRKLSSSAVASLLSGGLLLSGCNPGSPGNTVQVSATSPATPSSQPSSLLQKRTSVKATKKVFFERVLTEGTRIDQLIAISFSSQDSATTTPMGIALKNPQDFSLAPIFFPGDDRVIFRQSNGFMNDSLVSANLETLDTQALFDFPNAVTAVSVSAKASAATWIDVNGAAYVADLSKGSVQALSIPAGSAAVRIQLSASGTRLIVQTNKGVWVLYTLQGSEWTQGLQVFSVVAGALDADGARLVYVGADAKLYLADLAKSSVTLITTLQSTAVHDLSLPPSIAGAPGSALYWTRLSSGASEIRAVTLDPGAKEQSLARISIPPNVTDTVVCPALDGNTLLFSNFSQGEYRIERASLESKVIAQGVPFAIPPMSDEGFICPKFSQEISK